MKPDITLAQSFLELGSASELTIGVALQQRKRELFGRRCNARPKRCQTDQLLKWVEHIIADVHLKKEQNGCLGIFKICLESKCGFMQHFI